MGGDLGNIHADEIGDSSYNEAYPNKELPLSGANSIIGRGMIIHHDPDDCKSQPTGNAGSRIAQCVVGYHPCPK